MPLRFPLMLFLLLLTLPLLAQEEQGKEGPNNSVLTVGLEAGFNSYIGDHFKGRGITLLTNVRSDFGLTLEKRFGNFLGVGLHGIYGQLAGSCCSDNTGRNMNFETRLMQFGLDATLHLDNDRIMPRNASFVPFIRAGAGYMMFTPYADLKDKNGNTYHYWEDGTIRSVPENDAEADSAVILSRDYDYETALSDTNSSLKTSGLSFPLTAGFKWKLLPRIEGRVQGTYVLTMTDQLDGFKANGDNDPYLRLNFSLHYKIGKDVPEKEEDEVDERYKDVDFESIDSEDMDGDGVGDLDDECPNTPPNVAVNSKGCPKDSDGDGVPDHVDQEPDTEKGARVDQHGVTLTDERIAELQKETRDSLNVVESKGSSGGGDIDMLGEINANRVKRPELGDQKKEGDGDSNSLPPDIAIADRNNDGFISSNEITWAIDAFFEGSPDLSPEKLRRMIDYFFEQ